MHSDYVLPQMHFDVVIVGAGPAGLCFAASIASQSLRIAVVESQSSEVLHTPPFDGREIALTHASAQRLRDLDIWSRIPAEDISALRDARVLNGDSPRFMHLDHRDSRCEQLGFLVSNHLIRRAAFERIADVPHISLLTGKQVTAVTTHNTGARLQLSSGETLGATLVVAADSRFSQTRRAMGIPADIHDFGKTMLVCRMRHEWPHEQIAYEWFDYGQTLALLPMNGDRSSVVITLPHHAARRLQELDAAAFNVELSARYLHRFGAMQLVSQRFLYPLVAVYPRRLIATRFAVIGDAAVGMHPVTAHGFNLGLAGQATLAAEITAALSSHQDIGNPSLLERYERAQRRATRPLYLATNALVQLYTNDAMPTRIARAALLRLCDHVAPFKQAIVRGLTNMPARR